MLASKQLRFQSAPAADRLGEYAYLNFQART